MEICIEENKSEEKSFKPIEQRQEIITDNKDHNSYNKLNIVVNPITHSNPNSH